ncbi:hypothetical protein [Dactylosporangium sp. NPDC048998]|uniref:hypothetical protein n=1 Tax=Dactylosporangium sp. NPDC048998 TaxID=3363976 RepID=UPI003713C9AD
MSARFSRDRDGATGDDRMGPLKRRYRALIRILPADHRAARGEELLGLLLDLDEGRERPSLRQAAGVVGLGLRLRLAATATLVLAALLIALSTGMAALWIGSVFGSAVAPSPRPAWQLVALTAVPAAVALAAAATWATGQRRTTLWLLVAQPLAAFAAARFEALTVPMIAGPAVLAFAAWLLPVPRPRRALLLTMPLAALLWSAESAWGRHSLAYPLLDTPAAPALAGAGAGLGLLAALLMARRTGWFARAAAGLAGAVAGASVPTLALSLISGEPSWTLAVTAAVTAVAAAAGRAPAGQTNHVLRTAR